jgi:hypothetical protein
LCTHNPQNLEKFSEKNWRRPKGFMNVSAGVVPTHTEVFIEKKHMRKGHGKNA